MPKNTIMFPKMSNTGLSIYNENGLELSFAEDGSCGALRNNTRMSVAVYNGTRQEDEVEPDRPFSGDAEEFLQKVAKHLGYVVVKPSEFDPDQEWVVLRESGGKYDDGYYGWDGNIHSEEQIYKKGSEPYKPCDDIEVVVVGKGNRPTVSEVVKILEKIR